MRLVWDCCSMCARLVVCSGMTKHRSRPEHEQTAFCHRVASANTQHDNGEGVHNNRHTSYMLQHISIWWRSLDKPVWDTSTNTPGWSAIVVCDPTIHTWLWMRIRKVSHDFTAFSGMPPCQLTQPIRLLRHLKDFVPEPVLRCLQIRGRGHAVVM